MTEPTPMTSSEARTLPTRFGPIPIDPERTISFRYGVYGFGGHTRFVLADVPERDVPFRLLQSADDPDVGFLVLPVDIDEGPIARDDLDRACAEVGIERTGLVALAIVTLRAELGEARGTANLKAPILIDASRRQGCQYVLDDGYALQVPLPVAS